MSKEMNCEKTINVSAMVDGEVSDTERETLKAHIEGCPECREAEAGFVFLKNQIKGLAIDQQTSVRSNAPFIQRRISIPAPVFAIAILLIAGLFTGLLITGRSDQENTARINRPVPQETKGASLARFDSGGVAQIYKEPKR